MLRESQGHTRFGPLAAAIGAVLALVLAGCGSSSSSSTSNPQTLLKQTFGSSHSIKSGVLDFALTVTPSGSSTLTTPITLSVSGPFQSRGTGKLPQSALTLAISALGHRGSLGVTSTGTAAYASLEGVSYQLPSADYAKLASSLSSTTGSSGSGGAPGLSALGIDPLHWLTSPSIVGTENVAGAATTHIRAGVDVSALISDLDTLLAKDASKLKTGSTVTQISPATAQKIAAAIKNPTVDIWTGQSDKTLRKLSLDVTVPVTGKASTELGGMTSAQIGLTVQYSGLNHAQSITAPTNLQPYSQFTAKLQGLAAELESTFGGSSSSSGSSGTSGSSGSSGTTGSSATSGSTPTTTSGSSAGLTKYSQCIERAGTDVKAMQKCAPLLNGSGG